MFNEARCLDDVTRAVAELVAALVSMAVIHLTKGEWRVLEFLQVFVPDALRSPRKVSWLVNQIASGEEIELPLGGGLTLFSYPDEDRNPRIAVLAPFGSGFAMQANQHIKKTRLR